VEAHDVNENLYMTANDRQNGASVPALLQRICHTCWSMPTTVAAGTSSSSSAAPFWASSMAWSGLRSIVYGGIVKVVSSA
jgi:hypothetical protein